MSTDASSSNKELAVDKNNDGVARFKMEDLEGAFKSFQEAVELDPTLEEARENRDMVVERLGRDPLTKSRAEALTREPIDLDEIPDSPVKDAIGWVVERGMYLLAAVIGVLILVFLWGIHGWLGITVLIVGALIVWLLKWSFLIMLK